MDRAVTEALNQFLARRDGLEDPLAFYATASEYLFAGLVAVLLVVGLARRRRELFVTAVMALASAAGAMLIATVVSSAVGRARPFVADSAIRLFSAHPPDPGFPSDHATAGFAIAVAIWLRHRVLGSAALVAAAVLSLDRVALGLHYPTDVLAGAAIGASVAFALHRAGTAGVVDALGDRARGLRNPRSQVNTS